MVPCDNRRLRQERATLQASLERLNADIAVEGDRMRSFKDMMVDSLHVEVRAGQQAPEPTATPQVECLALNLTLVRSIETGYRCSVPLSSTVALLRMFASNEHPEPGSRSEPA